jgi:hypothetical protein
VLLRQVAPLAVDAALGRLAGEGDKVRRYSDFRYAVTNLPGLPKSRYEKLYCAKGQAENRKT